MQLLDFTARNFKGPEKEVKKRKDKEGEKVGVDISFVIIPLFRNKVEQAFFLERKGS